MLEQQLNYSKAFFEYRQNRQEIIELLRVVPSIQEQLHSRKSSQLANALYRGSVVLMSSHLERYVEALVVEAIDAINLNKPNVNTIPPSLRMAQIRQPLRHAHEIEDIVAKTNMLRSLVTDYAWFWDSSHPCDKLRGDDLINEFDNPLPKRIRLLFAPFGNSDVVGPAISLDKSDARPLIEIKVRELVEKRNAIAHTGMTADLTREDVITYLSCSRRLVRGIDRIFGKQIQAIIGNWPWK
ncbi:MAG: MAE_28990/MAE_18760 family HEPN-like nuclease [Caldilineaceae bacterium]